MEYGWEGILPYNNQMAIAKLLRLKISVLVNFASSSVAEFGGHELKLGKFQMSIHRHCLTMRTFLHWKKSPMRLCPWTQCDSDKQSLARPVLSPQLTL